MRALIAIVVLLFPMAVWGQTPAVKIIAPKDGYSCPVGTPVDLMVWTRPGLKVSSVTVLSEDGSGIGMASEPPWTVQWDTSQARPGAYTLRAQVTLYDGTTRDSVPVMVVLQRPPGPAGVTLKEGTPVLLANEDRMVSGETPEGTVVRYKVDKDVLGPNGEILIPAGSPGYGTVVKSEGSGFFGRSGALNITLESVHAADQTPVALRAQRNATADDQETAVIVGAVLVSVFFVFMEGDDVVIPPGTLFTGFVRNDTLIAKPGAPRLSQAELKLPRSVSMLVPSAGGRVKREDQVVFSCSTTPQDDSAYVRLYMDDVLVAWQKGNLSSIACNTRRSDAIDRLFSPGQHTMVAEVTFTSGHVVKSEPVTFTVVED
ncbi:MAG: Ig-like domain-containing protein [Candidatus Eremiobacterota bacterium]